MESIKESIPKSLERLQSRARANKGFEYRSLWMNVSYAVARDGFIREIGAQAFGIFTVIRTFMDKNGISYPSLRTIAYQSGCSVGTVMTAIKILEKSGWVKKVGRVIQKGKYGNTKYLIIQRDLVRGTGDKNFLSKPITNFDNG